MARSTSELTKAELQELRMYEARLESGLSTQAEKNEARKKIDEILWAGGSGPIMKKLATYEKKIELLEREVASVREALASTASVVIEEAKMAIAEEAKAQAIIAVSEYMGSEKPEDDS